MGFGNTSNEIIQIDNKDLQNQVDAVDNKIGLLSDLKTTDQSSLVNAVNENVSQLAETAKYINVKKYGAKGDGVTDDTTPIQSAITDATNNRQPLYFPAGTYLISANLVIPDNGLLKMFGDGKDTTTLLFNLTSGVALEVQSYYSRNVEIADMTLKLNDTTQDVSGLKVTTPSTWGACINMTNVNITDFTANVLEGVEMVNSTFKNCRFTSVKRNGVRVGTLLKLSKVTNFGENNQFINCVFYVGKIGFQNVGATTPKFQGCIFEDLSLFHHISQVAGLSMYELFEVCWFENIDKFILNADINESTLTPLSPVSNKANIERLRFNSNAVIGLTSPYLDSSINQYQYNDFDPIDGLKNTYKQPTFAATFTANNGGDNTVNTIVKMNEIFYLNPANSPLGVFTYGAAIIVVEVVGYNGSKMQGVFITSNYQTDIVLQGTVKDPNAIGTEYKIQGLWGGSGNTLNIQAKGMGLTDMTVKYSLLPTP